MSEMKTAGAGEEGPGGILGKGSTEPVGIPGEPGALFERYYDTILSYAARRLLNMSDAEDVTAETFSRAFAALPSISSSEPARRAWLYRTATNLIHDLYRRRGRRCEVQLDAVKELGRWVADPGPDPEVLTARLQELRALSGAMSVLSDARSLDRSAYTVHHEDGMIIAVATVEKDLRPAGRVPIRLNQLKTRRTFVFDAGTGLLRRVRIEGLWRGRWLTLALIDRIQYRQLDPARFRIDLPRDVVWSETSTAHVPRAAFGSPGEVARRFLRAWVEQDAATLRELGGGTPYDKLLLPERTGSPAPMAVVSLGTPERDPDGIYPGVWVPYAVRFPDGHVKRHRLALKQGPDGAWFVDGGI